MNSGTAIDAALKHTIDELLAGFGLRGAAVELLGRSPHVNLRVRSRDGDYFLKIASDAYDAGRIRSQLAFMDYLRNGGLPVVETFPASNGEPCARSADGRSTGILSRWIHGRLVSELPEPQWPGRCGELLARLHRHSAAFAPPAGFDIRSWEHIYAPPPDGWLIPFLDQAAFDDDSRSVILQSAEQTRRLVRHLADHDDLFGVIHADFHRENLIYDGTTVWIIDFEEIGWGHYLFDVTWPELLYARRHDPSRYSAQFRGGYERVRPFTAAEIGHMPQFRLAAGIGALEMIDTSPAPNDGPVAREWFAFIIDWMRRSLAEV